MARAFLRKGAEVVAKLDPDERVIVAGLMSSTRELLAPHHEETGDPFLDLIATIGPLGDADRPSDRVDSGQPDPALARLLPTAHKGDDAVATEFRRLTEESLRQRKSGNLDFAVDQLESVGLPGHSGARDELRLDLPGAARFAMALTDVRLLIGERLGLRTDEDAIALDIALQDLADDDPAAALIAWYSFLTWLQESLADAMLGDWEPPAGAL